jgi:hypothetical protein
MDGGLEVGAMRPSQPYRLRLIGRLAQLHQLLRRLCLIVLAAPHDRDHFGQGTGIGALGEGQTKSSGVDRARQSHRRHVGAPARCATCA